MTKIEKIQVGPTKKFIKQKSWGIIFKSGARCFIFTKNDVLGSKTYFSFLPSGASWGKRLRESRVKKVNSDIMKNYLFICGDRGWPRFTSPSYSLGL